MEIFQGIIWDDRAYNLYIYIHINKHININIYKQKYYIGGLYGGAGSDIFDRLLTGQT